jgi:YXWGXW repeat-containing protein
MSGQKEVRTMRTLVVIRSLLFAVMLMALSAASFAQIGISVAFGPPALPVYEQPICPGDGYIWTPGYWAWDGNDYYWVPGTWVEAPEVGFLWTPGYWGWGGNAFFFHEGYWGPHVGYYGGINYGFGYGGRGYEGGRWENNHFYYNTSVNHINNENIHNTYNTRVEYNSGNRVSYNGGNGGVNERPSSQEETYDKERHTGPVAAQNQHMQQARSNPELRASANHGKPPIAATAKPGDFKGSVVPAREAGAPYKAPERTAPANEARPANTHASEVQPHKYAAPTTGNAETDKKYQQQQDKMAAKQNQEHQRLQQQQEKEHQQMAQKNASEAQKQQMEQRHAQQTQQLEQKHTAQQQKVQTHQQPHQSAPPAQSHPPAEKH